MARKKLVQALDAETIAILWGCGITRMWNRGVPIEVISELLLFSLEDIEIGEFNFDTKYIKYDTPDGLWDKYQKLSILSAIAHHYSESFYFYNRDGDEFAIQDSDFIRGIFSERVIETVVTPFLLLLEEFRGKAAEPSISSDVKQDQVDFIGFREHVELDDEFNLEYDIAYSYYDNIATIEEKVHFYSCYQEVIDLLNGDLLLVNDLNSAYYQDLQSMDVSTAIAAVDNYMKGRKKFITRSGFFERTNWIRMPSKRRYFFINSDLTFLTPEQREWLGCKSIAVEIVYFDLPDLAYLPATGIAYERFEYSEDAVEGSEVRNPQTYLRFYGFPSEVIQKCIFWVPLASLEFSHDYESYLPQSRQLGSAVAAKPGNVNINPSPGEPKSYKPTVSKQSNSDASFYPSPHQSIKTSQSIPGSSQIGFLDIETTGFSPTKNHITTAVLVKPDSVTCFVIHQNLNELPRAILECETLVTFNGARFDLPFIEKTFDINISTNHIDLMKTFKSLNLVGGQKRIEKLLGISRTSDDIDGRIAVDLWNEYCLSSDNKYLETLLAYNYDDSLSLVALYNKAISLGGLQDFQAVQPHESVVTNPFKVHWDAVKRFL